ncbi:MAG: hypothetical protein JW884_09060 [Deltaproteobacteria bacterium]|nr:hypothetical protein [Deltaproteobacteria bacterium]
MEQKREFQLTSTEKLGILEIVISGKVTVKTAGTVQQEVFALLSAMKIKRLIVDVRTLKGRLGLADAYFRVREYPAEAPRVKTAVVDIEENSEFQSFHETAACNVGLLLRWFTDMDDARAWVASSPD